MMYCNNTHCPLERVFDGGSHGFRCPACGQSLVMTQAQLLRSAVVFLLLGMFGALVCVGVLSDTSWGELISLDSPLAAATLTAATLAGAVGGMFGFTQLLVWVHECRSRAKSRETGKITEAGD